MGATIRLMRYGKRNQPSYRIVVLDKRKKRDGKYIEKIGVYDPLKEKDAVSIDKERVEYWISRGAELSEGISKLIKHKKKPGKKVKKNSSKKTVKAKKTETKTPKKTKKKPTVTTAPNKPDRSA